MEREDVMGRHDKRKMLMAVKHKRRKRAQDNCHNKRRYLFHEAQVYAEAYNQQPYNCPSCGMWHLASKKEKQWK